MSYVGAATAISSTLPSAEMINVTSTCAPRIAHIGTEEALKRLRTPCSR
jgi:hypothetical protein